MCAKGGGVLFSTTGDNIGLSELTAGCGGCSLDLCHACTALIIQVGTHAHNPCHLHPLLHACMGLAPKGGTPSSPSRNKGGPPLPAHICLAGAQHPHGGQHIERH